MNARVGKCFFKEKMANLKVFIAAKVCKTYRRHHFTKTVIKFSIEICSKMTLIGNYTCSQSVNEKSHLCLAKYL